MQTPAPSPLKTYLGLWKKHPGASVFALARYYLPWSASLKPGRMPLVDRQIWIVFAARALLDRELRPGMRIFEYGMGGSTLYFLSRGCRLVSVEHDADWYRQISETVTGSGYASQWEPCLRRPDAFHFRPGANDSLTYLSEFGSFAGRTFHDYVGVIDGYPDGAFDVVLVDGRARPSCLLRARGKVKPGGWLVLDNSERPRYQEAHAALKAEEWRRHEFFGPGPYVTHEFWGTTVWQRNASEAGLVRAAGRP